MTTEKTETEKDFEKLLGVTLIQGDQIPEPVKQETLPFSQALVVLLTKTDEGKDLHDNLISRKVSITDYRKNIFELADKYRHLIVVS